MANTYCENKSNKPVITRYDPSKNYVVQMVESLESIDYPNENHIYVIESTGEKYIYYNGAFSEFESSDLEPLMVTATVGTITTGDADTYMFSYSNDVTYSKTYSEIKNAVDNGQPIVLSYNGYNYKCSAREESGKITLDAFSGFLDSATRPRYKTESFVIKSDETGQYIRTIFVLYAIDGLNDYVMALQAFTGRIPFMYITGDENNGISVTETGVTNDAKYALYAWGTQRGITPIISFTYTNGDNETVTKKLVRINGNAYESDGYSLTALLDEFEVRVNNNTTIQPNRNKTMNIGAIGDATASLHLKIVIADTLYRYDITAINGDVSEGIIVPLEDQETNYMAIPIDGKNVSLRNIYTGNVTFAPDVPVAHWRIV